MKVNQLKIGAILSYTVLILNMLVGILYTPILTKSLGQSEYGIYSMVASIITMLTVLDFGFGNAIIVYTNKYKAQKNKEKEQKLHGMFFLIYTVIGVIAGIIGIILYLNVDRLFDNTMSISELLIAKKLMLILTFNLIITFSFSIFSSIITAYEKFIFSKSLNIMRIILSPVIMYIFLKMGYRSIALVSITTILNVGVLSLNLFYCLKKLKISLKFKGFDLKILKEIIAYSFWVFLNSIVDKINWTVDQFILGSVSGAVAVSVYSIGAQLNHIYLSFSTAISGVLLPKITKMESEKCSDDEFTKIFIKTGRIQFLMMGLVITGFVLFGKQFILLWQGIDYIKSYYIACILMIPVTVPLIQNVGISILQAKNKIRFRSLMLVAIACLNVVLSIILSRKYEGIGSAIGSAISFVIGQIIIMNIYYKKRVGIDIIKFWSNIIKMCIPVAITVLFGVLINKICYATSYKVLIVEIMCYSLVYMVMSWIFIMNDNEKNIFIKPLKVITSKLTKN